MAVFKGALLLGLAPKDFVVAVGVEGRVNVNQIHIGVGQLGELFQIVATVNDAGVEEGRGFQFGGRDALLRVLADPQCAREICQRQFRLIVTEPTRGRRGPDVPGA